jgi:hypothetical protein
VVGVAEDDLGSLMVGAEFFEGSLGDGFDGALGAYWHENGRLDGLVGEMQAGATGAAFAGGLGAEEFETEGHILIVLGARVRGYSCPTQGEPEGQD